MPLFKRNPVDGSAGPGTGSSTANTNMRSSGKSLLPKWMLGLRALQWLLAILVLGLACYAQHIYKNTGLQGGYITAIIVSALTLLVLLPLTTLIHFAAYHPLIALAADLIATLLWLITLAVLATYSHIYSGLDNSYLYSEYYRSGDAPVGLNARTIDERQYSSAINGANGNFGAALKVLRRAWACGAAAAAFAGLEFLLFLLTTLLFLRYYHRARLAAHAPPTYGHNTAAATTPASSYPTTTLDSQHGGRGADQYEMQRPADAHSGYAGAQDGMGAGLGKDEVAFKGSAGV